MANLRVQGKMKATVWLSITMWHMILDEHSTTTCGVSQKYLDTDGFYTHRYYKNCFFSPSHILPWSVQKHHTSKHWVPHNFNNHVLSLVVVLSFGLWAPQFQWREVLMQQHNDILHNNVLLTLCQLFVFGPFLFKRNNAQSQLHKRTVFPVLVWKTAMTSTSSNNFGMNWKVNISDRPCE